MIEFEGVDAGALSSELLAFFADRLKVHLKDAGMRHDLISAVFAAAEEDDLVRLLAKVEALRAFLATDDGANLLTALRRASNIVRIEEKRDRRSYAGQPDERRLEAKEEQTLFFRLDDRRPTTSRPRWSGRRSARRWPRSPACASRSMPSSTGSRSTPRIRSCARTVCTCWARSARRWVRSPISR